MHPAVARRTNTNMFDYSCNSDLNEEVQAELQQLPRAPWVFHQQFEEDISELIFRQRYLVPRSVVDYLEVRLCDQLNPQTQRNMPIMAREKIKVFLHFLGTNGFYHAMRDCHGVDTHTVFRIIQQVGEALFEIYKGYLHWSDNQMSLADQFFDIGGFSSVCGVVDGTHINNGPMSTATMCTASMLLFCADLMST